MNYHNITTDDMMNGEGLRVVLWVAGCEHHCDGCHNPETWNPKGGIPFDIEAEEELFEELDKEHISGITFSGGDPLHKCNLETVKRLCEKIRSKYGHSKNIWVYTGYTIEDIVEECIDSNKDGVSRLDVICHADVLVEGKFEKELADVKYHWAGSTNQKIIRNQKSL